MRQILRHREAHVPPRQPRVVDADVRRRLAPDDDRLFTWWAPWRDHRVRNLGWRLDYVAASTGLVDETVHCVTYRDVGTSDHGPVIAHLRDAPAG